MAFAGGTRLGPYEIVARIGAGGMGEVYRARDVRLHRDVALKVLHPGPHADGARLLHEARVASTLSDPHIVAVHDVGEHDGAVFVAMELVDGRPLSQIVRSGLPIGEVLDLAIGVAAGLARAHAAGVVHRDLKPANVMVTRSGSAKILDFGLATRNAPVSGETSTVAALDGPGVVAGTVGYMSPEQAEGRPVDGRSDIFAFGVVLYELLTGRRPFDRESAAGTLAAILRDPPPPLVEARRDTPAQIGRIVDRCLRKDPERRFQSMTDLKAALEDVRDALGQPAAVATDAAAHRGTGDTTPRWVTLARAAALVGAGAAAAAALAWSRPAAPAPLAGTELTQLTFDPGAAATPVLSPDGSLLAFASDRGGDGNLDIWVQPVAGGDPVQVTRDPADDRMPAFSPDGGRLVFRSERDGGGLYSVPALGGEPRLLVPGGLSPRLSPDGRQLAYWTGTFIGFSERPGAYRTFVVDAAGGTPREIEGFVNSRFPVWSPDGTRLIVSASRADAPTRATYDWWIVPLGGGMPAAAGVRDLLGTAALDAGAQGSPSAWTGDRVLTSSLGDIWAVVLAGGNGPAVGVERLTFGPGREIDPNAIASGEVAFASTTSRTSIWSLPVDTERASVRGEFRRLTDGPVPSFRATMSTDERWVAFSGPGRPRLAIAVKDLVSGRVRDLGVVPGGTFGAVIAPDGQRVAYQAGGNELRTVGVNGGAPLPLCRGCQEAGDWTRDGRHVVVVTVPGGAPGGPTSLGLADATTGETSPLVAAIDERSLNRPLLSPDNRWLAFRAMGARQRVYVVPFGGTRPLAADRWVAIGADEADFRPLGWSPSGGMLYLFSARDGFRCLYVQRMNTETGRPEGPVTLVRHLHNVRAGGGGGASVVSTGAGNAVGRQQIIFDFPDEEASIWRMRLGVLAPASAASPSTP